MELFTPTGSHQSINDFINELPHGGAELNSSGDGIIDGRKYDIIDFCGCRKGGREGGRAGRQAQVTSQRLCTYNIMVFLQHF